MQRAAWGHALQAMGDVFGQGSIMDLVTFKVRKNNRLVNSNSYSSLSLRDSIPYRNPKTGQIFMYPLSRTDGRGKMFLLDKYFSDFSDKALAIRDVDIESTEFILKQYANDQNYIFAFGTKPKPASAAESALLPEYNLVSSHAYSILGYNESTKMVKIGNPHAYAEVTEIPIEKLHPYINHIEFLKI